MPVRIRAIVAALSFLYLAVFSYFASSGHWIYLFIWSAFGLQLLDVLWIKFDLEGATYWRGDKKSKTVALTFDDGPDPRFTPRLLDILNKAGVKATFFVLGKFAERNPDLIRRMAAEGHEIGSHGYAHTKYTKLGFKKIEEDMKKWGEVVEPLLPPSEERWHRPPHGLKHLWVRKAAHKLKYRLAGWTRGVWDTDNPGVDTIVENSVKNMRGGEILLLHDGDGSGNGGDRNQTVDSIEPIVEKLKSRGFEFKTLSALFPTEKRQINTWRLFLGAAVTVGFFAYVLKNFSIAEIRKNLTVPHPEYLLYYLAVDLGCLFCKSQAWREMILPLSPVKRLRAYAIFLAGAMMNNILPMRAGDVGRADLLGRKEDVDRVHGISTFMLEGVLNGISLLPVLFIAFLVFPLPPVLQKGALYFSILVVVGFTSLLTIAHFSDHPWLKAIRSLKHPKRVVFSFAFYLAAWFCYLGALTFSLKATGIEISFWATPVIALSLSASMFIPSGPARLGSFEAAIVFSLTLFSIPVPQALAYALVLHTLQTVPTLITGGIAWLIAEKTF